MIPTLSLVVGLGNPGQRYERNRHNVGYQVVDVLVGRHHLAFRTTKHRAVVAEGHISDRRVLIAKPTTYMNASGEAVAALLRYYSVPHDRMLIIYDDLDLPLGTLRVRPHGGAGGHRGMISIIERLDTQAFPRLRIGIGRPPGRMEPADYVLQDFSAAQEEIMATTRADAADAIEMWLTTDIETVMNRCN